MKHLKICEKKRQVERKIFKIPRIPLKAEKPKIDERFEKSTIINSFTKLSFTMTVPKRYSNLKFFGAGAQGTVVSAEDSETGGKVAIKKILVGSGDARRTYREFVLMTTIKHPTIIRLFNAFTPDPSLSKFSQIYLVMELMPYSLFDIIYGKGTEKPRVYNHWHLSFAIYQMLCGIKHLHDSKVTHRDLKPQNIAVNKNGDLKILDFGLARKLAETPTTMSMYVTTRSYRAPEVILEVNYDTQVDIWSIGCIIAEMINHKPLFLGGFPNEVCDKIFDHLGAPDEQFLANVTPSTADGIRMRRFVARDMKEFIGDVAEEKAHVNWTNEKLRDLLGKILKINPNERFTVEEALNHEYLGNWKKTKNEKILALAQNPNSEGIPRYDPDIEKIVMSRNEWKGLIFEEVQRFQKEHDVFKN